MAEQHIHLAHRRPGYIGIICTDLSLPDAVAFAAQRTKQVALLPLPALLHSADSSFGRPVALDSPKMLYCVQPVRAPLCLARHHPSRRTAYVKVPRHI